MKKAQEDNNVEDMKVKKDELNKIVQDLTVKLYQQAQDAQGEAGAEGAAKDPKDETVDGDFEEVKPEDKK